jgi:hypothetical protein
MPWWGYVLFLIAIAAAIWGFISLIEFSRKILSRETYDSYRTAENFYSNFADSPARQRRYAREHGGEWRDGENPRGPGSSRAP